MCVSLCQLRHPEFVIPGFGQPFDSTEIKTTVGFSFVHPCTYPLTTRNPFNRTTTFDGFCYLSGSC